ARFEDAFDAESDEADFCFVDPDSQTMRASIESLSIEMFYHCMISLAGEGLYRSSHADGWGMPPSSASDGYDFMCSLANHLHVKALHAATAQKMQEGHLPFSLFPGEATGRRKPMSALRTQVSGFV